MTPSEIAQIITDTNRRSTVVRFALSLLQINQVRGYCGRTDPAYEGEEVSDFYDGLEFVSKIDSDIRLCIDAYVNGEDWHRNIIGAPKLVITKNLLKVINTVSPQRSGRAYSECYLGLAPMAVTIMSREAYASIPEEQDSLERSLARSDMDVAKSKLPPLNFPKTLEKLMGWLTNWQIVLFLQYGPL
jgi:hypothetical protein